MNETTLGILITSITGFMTALITAVATAYTQITVERIKAEASKDKELNKQNINSMLEELPSKPSPARFSTFFQSVNWPVTILITAIAVSIMIIVLLFFPPTTLNRLITYHDFEGKNDGWSRVASTEYASDGTHKSEFPDDSFFPGSMTSEISTVYALTGKSSLKVTTSVNIAGDFKSYLRRRGTFTGNGVTIYVLAPDLTNVSIEYIQLCIPSHGWVCSDGTKLVAGEWTPITIDLSKSDENGNALYKQKLTEIAVQWRFYTKSPTSLDLYFDSVEIFSPGSL
jgi:hypothetical protein